MGFLSNLPILGLLGIQTLLNRTTCSIGRGGKGGRNGPWVDGKFGSYLIHHISCWCAGIMSGWCRNSSRPSASSSTGWNPCFRAAFQTTLMRSIGIGPSSWCVHPSSVWTIPPAWHAWTTLLGSVCCTHQSIHPSIHPHNECNIYYSVKGISSPSHICPS